MRGTMVDVSEEAGPLWGSGRARITRCLFPYGEEWSASHLLCTTTSFHIFTRYIYHTVPTANRKTINTGPTVGVPGSHCGVNHWLVCCDRGLVLISRWFSIG